MLSHDLIGTCLREAKAVAEAGQMRFFAEATGQTDSIFRDAEAARARGYRDIVAPPTFVYALQQTAGCDPFELFERLGVALEDTLHGEQQIDYGEPIVAGDTIHFSGAVTDIYSRKAGALEFLVYKTSCTNQTGALVARLRTVTIVAVR